MIETYTHPLDTTGDNHIKQASLRKRSNIHFLSSVLPRLYVAISSHVCIDLTVEVEEQRTDGGETVRDAGASGHRGRDRPH